MIKKFSYLFSFIAISFYLFIGCPLIVNENIIDIQASSSAKTFGARIGMVIPMATCVNPYTASACKNCGEGSWDDLTLLTIFGGGSSVEMFACKMPFFIPYGGGMCQISEVIFGQNTANQLAANGAGFNLWCQMQ